MLPFHSIALFQRLPDTQPSSTLYSLTLPDAYQTHTPSLNTCSDTGNVCCLLKSTLILASCIACNLTKIWLVHVQAQPFLSYGVLIVNLAVYAAGLGLRFSLGESSGEDYFYMLAKVNDEVVQGEYYRC